MVLFLHRIVLVCLGLLLLGPLAGAEELAVEDFSFEGPLGSPGTSVEQVGVNHFRVSLPRAPGHPEWGQMLRFTLKNAKGNSLRLDNGPSGLRCFGSYSYDGKTWHPVEKAVVEENGKKISTILFPEFTEETVYFGEEIPMSYEDMLGMIDQWKKHPCVSVHAIGESCGGRTIYRVTITDPGSPVPEEQRWVHHAVNQHCYEFNAMWRIVGMIEWLLGDEAAEARKRHIGHFVVMMNVDGPSSGFARVNAQGFDMNRGYSSTGADSEKQPKESYVVQKDMEQIHAKTPLTTTWSMHTWAGPKVDLLVRPGPQMQEGELGSWKDFQAIVFENSKNGQFNPFQHLTGEPSLTHWCSGTHVQFGCSAFCCEGCGEMRTIEENKQVGETLMKSLAEFFE